MMEKGSKIAKVQGIKLEVNSSQDEDLIQEFGLCFVGSGIYWTILSR